MTILYNAFISAIGGLVGIVLWCFLVAFQPKGWKLNKLVADDRVWVGASVLFVILFVGALIVHGVAP